ncbi:hypothetical protein ENSA5_43070 [Enhygromyxa salina]|uniref:Lipoprotein n=1 Tax=Enhygromyxa salina TaxID=215803 RepID=A0A2S9XKK0_9BACT|nr:hypothetical protein [Enhygromyxa salina]PRP93408.1 hypothetical protein ENSA5_43070 [Enhygromyxa salina]
MRPAWQTSTCRCQLALALALGLGCGDEREAPDAKPPVVERDRAAEASGRAERFAAAPDWDTLIELLGQRHNLARELLGPHRMHYVASLRTGPVGVEADAPLPSVELDQPIYERFAVTDELELRWGSAPGEPIRLLLEQHNEHEHGRALIVLGEQVWSQLDGREWLARPLESDLWQVWADDAQHAVLDLVELAGPYADLGEVETTELDGRPALRVSLRASEQQHPDRFVEPPSPWRRWARVEIGAATIVVDRATGLWLSAQIELSWSFEDRAGRELRGEARFDGRVEVPDAPPLIRPPADASPVPERERPELLRQRMLDGLAGP